MDLSSMTIVSILRLQSLVQFANTKNITREYFLSLYYHLVIYLECRGLRDSGLLEYDWSARRHNLCLYASDTATSAECFPGRIRIDKSWFTGDN